ncbi:MAG: ABC transporter transmembrane domain-containing protein [bacterium]
MCLSFYRELLIIIFLLSPLLRKKSKERLKERAGFDAYLCEALGGIRTIKAFVAENRISHFIKRYFIKYNRAFFKESLLESTSFGTANLLTLFSILFIFSFCYKGKAYLGVSFGFFSFI